MLNKRWIKFLLVFIGILQIALGVLLILEQILPNPQNINAISIVNATIIAILGMIPLGIAVLIHIDNNQRNRSNYSRNLAYYWIIFASIMLVIVLILNILY